MRMEGFIFLVKGVFIDLDYIFIIKVEAVLFND